MKLLLSIAHDGPLAICQADMRRSRTISALLAKKQTVTVAALAEQNASCGLKGDDRLAFRVMLSGFKTIARKSRLREAVGRVCSTFVNEQMSVAALPGQVHRMLARVSQPRQQIGFLDKNQPAALRRLNRNLGWRISR